MSQQGSNFSSQSIAELIENLNGVADEIRETIENLSDLERREKAKGSPVGSGQYSLDVIADDILHKRIKDFPGYIISEERELDKSKIDSSELILVVDPVDGSTNASRKIGYWSFSAALVQSGSVIAGLIVDQVTGRKFIATQDQAAILMDQNGESKILGVPQIGQTDLGSRADNFSGSLICFNSHEGPSIPFRHLRHFGSSALSICDVAVGGLDAYIDDEDVLLRPWDLLAAEYIAKSAGCKVLRRDSSGVLAATGVLVTSSEALLEDFEKLFPHFF